MPLSPKPKVVPHIWKWSDLYLLAKRAGDPVPVGRGSEHTHTQRLKVSAE